MTPENLTSPETNPPTIYGHLYILPTFSLPLPHQHFNWMNTAYIDVFLSWGFSRHASNLAQDSRLKALAAAKFINENEVGTVVTMSCRFPHMAVTYAQAMQTSLEHSQRFFPLSPNRRSPQVELEEESYDLFSEINFLATRISQQPINSPKDAILTDPIHALRVQQYLDYFHLDPHRYEIIYVDEIIKDNHYLAKFYAHLMQSWFGKWWQFRESHVRHVSPERLTQMALSRRR